MWLPIYPFVNEVRFIPASAVQTVGGTPTIPASSAWIRTPNDSFVKDGTLALAMQREAAGDKQGAIQLYQQAASNPNADPNTVNYSRNAIARFNQVEDVSDEERKQAFANIKKAAKHYEVEITAKSWRELGKS